MNNSVVVVVPGVEEQRRRLARDGVPCWAAALHAVLEKHGYLDLELRGEEALTDPALFREPRAVLVPTLGSGAWSADAAAAALRGPAQTFVEGPLPAVVRDALRLAQKPARLRNEGALQLTDAVLRRHAATFGATPGGTMNNGSERPVDIDPALHWARNPAVPISPAQADAWRQSGWEADDLGPLPTDLIVMATFAPREGKRQPRPAIVRRDALTAGAVGLLSFVARAHTSEPYAAGQWRSWPGTFGVELVLIALLDDLLARAGIDRVRVLPWRRHVGWALSVRHDIDRFPEPEHLAGVLRRHARVGTKATWYWRARHLAHGKEAEAALLRVASAAGHEVALHTEQLWSSAAIDEHSSVQAALRSPVRGTCAHGDPTCFRYQGAPNILAAAHAGFAYTEMLQHGHLHPHRFVTLAADGIVSPLAVICLPHHQSFDLGTGPGEHQGDLIAQRFASYQRAGGLMQVLNHPDLHLDELFEVLGKAPEENRIDVSAISAVEWWRRSHVCDEFELERQGDRHRARSRRGVDDLVLERRRPDGSTRRVALSLPPGVWVDA